MCEMNPVPEILMATYNGEEFVHEQIDSILAQSDTRWHLTISDDGSTDTTPAIIDEYVRKYPDKIARHVSGRRFGNARDHFFHLMRVCKADYMFFCDQDDVWYSDKIKKTMEAMISAEKQRSASTPLLVFTDQTPTDGELHPLSPSLMRYQQQYFDVIDYRALLMQNIVTGGAMAINRALADLAGECIDETQTIMHDWWLAVVAARFGKVVYIDEALSDYRQHGTNSVGAKDVRSAGYVMRMLAQVSELQKKIAHKKRQTMVFQDTYRVRLCEADDAFLSEFSKSRSRPWFYLKNRSLIHGRFRLLGWMMMG